MESLLPRSGVWAGSLLKLLCINGPLLLSPAIVKWCSWSGWPASPAVSEWEFHFIQGCFFVPMFGDVFLENICGKKGCPLLVTLGFGVCSTLGIITHLTCLLFLGDFLLLSLSFSPLLLFGSPRRLHLPRTPDPGEHQVWDSEQQIITSDLRVRSFLIMQIFHPLIHALG